jgi:hypothetical protein
MHVGFGREIWGKLSLWKTEAYMGDNIKVDV